MAINLREFLRSYIECALWSTNNDEQDPEGTGHAGSLDDHYCREDIDEEALDCMRRDCERFIEKNLETLEAASCDRGNGQWSKSELAGHDFWLTRNGHGAGFWDGDWSDPQAETLAEASRTYGPSGLYTSEGKVYIY